MIKVLHSSDWHLGRSLFAKSLLEDQTKALLELESIIANEKPALVLLAGDLYDRSIPPEEAVRLLDKFLSKVILELNTPVAMIPGNHDSNTRIGVSADLLRAAGLHVFSTPESTTCPIRIDRDETKIAVYGIPYLEPNEWGFHFGRPLRTHNDALIAILDSLEDSFTKDRAEGRRIILMLHAYVNGGEATESERPLAIGGSDLVSVELLSNFDYVALGHLHRSQVVGSDRIRYPGSLFPYSQAEASQKKGAMLVSLGAVPAEDIFQFQPFNTTRGLQVIRGDLKSLSKPVTPTDDYVVAILTDQSLPFEAYRQLQQIHSGLLHVGRDINWSRDDAEAADRLMREHPERKYRQLSDRDVLAQFISAAAANETSDLDREWLVLQLEEFEKTDALMEPR